jgi:putative spermidine/putrescine transport system permease protein
VGTAPTSAGRSSTSCCRWPDRHRDRAALAFARSFEEDSVSLFLYDPPSTTLPVAILGAMRSQFNLTLASASVVMMGVTAVLVLVLDRVFGLDRIIGAGIYRS